jgi:ABC-2 type transport system ATP-binding protein
MNRVFNKDTAVLVQDLSKTYITKQRKGIFKSEKRDVEALKGVSLEVKSGEIFGLLGPNGAGKTTLIKILTTLLLPTEGEAWLNGYHIEKDANKVRASVGCMLMGERGLYWKLTARENLMYFGALYHLSPEARVERTNEIIDLIGIGDIADRTVETYSSGQKMKLAFGKALINDAPLLVLDEPTNTLDVPSASELRAVVRQLNAQGKTIIYTTHIMAEAETLCERVAIIDHGKLLAIGPVPELKTSLGKDQVTRIEGVIPNKATEAVRALSIVHQATLSAVDGASQLTIVTSNGTNTLPRLIETLSQHGATIQKIVPEEVTLEDVFIAKTGRTLAEDTRVTVGKGNK